MLALLWSLSGYTKCFGQNFFTGTKSLVCICTDQNSYNHVEAILYYTVYVYVYVYCMNNLVLLQLPSVIYSTKQQHTQSHPIHVDDTHQTRMIHIRQAHTNKH